MSRYSLLTLDLNKEVTSEQRTKFYDKLAELKWRKNEPTTTLWLASWKDNVTDQELISTTHADVEAAATFAGVASYDATVAICGKPISWSKKPV